METKNTNMETKNNDWAKRDVGALWKREGKNQKYLSGYVKVDELGIEREFKIVVFSNKNKKDNEKAPDYRIYVSKPVENISSNTANGPGQLENTNKVFSPQKTKVVQKVVQKAVQQESQEEDLL